MKEFVLSELIEFSRDGEWGEAEPFDRSIRMAVIRGTDFEAVQQGVIESVPIRYIKEKNAKYKSLHGGEIIIEAAGGTKGRITGRTIYLKPETVARFGLPVTCASFSRFIRLKNSEFCNAQYLFWLLQYLYHFGYMDKYNTQHTGDSRFQWTVFAENEPLCFPDLDSQRKIVSILSSYNDLIENNLRRIKILETMAQSIFDEWFVNFHFPNHHQVRFNDSPAGLLPDGWGVKRLDELCSAILDGDWIETKDQGGNEYRLLQISNIGVGDFVETGNYRYVTQETFTRLNCTEIRPDDLLIARMPSPIGRGWLARKMPWRMITAVDVAIARPDCTKLDPIFLLYFWNQPSTLAAIEKQSSGTTRMRITKRQLCAMLVPSPPLYLQHEFSKIARPILDLANNLRDQNLKLSRTRDLLLPRLISGKINVSGMNIEVPTEA